MKYSLSALLFLCLSFASFQNVHAYTMEIIDVPNSHPNYGAIHSLVNQGVMQGYADGKFRPNQSINRAEALKIILRSTDNTCCQVEYGRPSPFRDTEPYAWYVPYILTALDRSIISGYSDGTFRPARGITSPELIKILARHKGIYIQEYGYTQSPYQDVSPNAWYVGYLTYAKERGILPQNSLIRPEKALTRGEASEIIYRFSMETSSSSTATYEENIYSIPAESHILPPTYGETAMRDEAFQNKDIFTSGELLNTINETERRISAAYPQPTVATPKGDEWNWWPVYNVSQSINNGVNTKFPDSLFGPVIFMNAWTMVSNTVEEINKYTPDHVNYEYEYNDISEPGEYVYIIE